MIESLPNRLAAFLDGQPHAVVGASTNRDKYGNKVLRCYMQNQRPVHPINPRAAQIEGLTCFSNLTDLPVQVHGISIITPPAITEQIIEEAGKLGIRHVWMQPGAQSDKAVARALELGMNVIAGDACLLMVLGYREEV